MPNEFLIISKFSLSLGQEQSMQISQISVSSKPTISEEIETEMFKVRTLQQIVGGDQVISLNVSIFFIHSLMIYSSIKSKLEIYLFVTFRL